MSALVKQEPTWWQSLSQRVRWAWMAFSAPSMQPTIQLQNGVYLDLANGRVVIPGNFHIHAQGNLRLTSDAHVILRSGAMENGGPGYLFFNTREDEQGNPILDPSNVVEHQAHEHEH